MLVIADVTSIADSTVDPSNLSALKEHAEHDVVREALLGPADDLAR